MIYSESAVCCFLFTETERELLFRTVCFSLAEGMVAKYLYPFLQRFTNWQSNLLSVKKKKINLRIDPVFRLPKTIVFT